MFGRKKPTDGELIATDLRATKAHLGHAARTAASATSSAVREAYAGVKESLRKPSASSARKQSKVEKLIVAEAARKKPTPPPPPAKEPEPQQPSFTPSGDNLLPLVENFMTSVSDTGDTGRNTAMLEGIDSRRAKELQKEAKKRAQAVASALRGERRRRWPLMVAAFAVGTAVGALASLALRQGAERWTSKDLQDAAAKTKEKITGATKSVAEKTSSAAHALADKTNKAADMLKDKAGSAADKVSGQASSATDKANSAMNDNRVLANQTR